MNELKTIRGKCTYTPDLSTMRPATREKFNNDLDFIYLTADDIKVGDVIRINRHNRYAFFHCVEVMDDIFQFRHKTEPILKTELDPEDDPNDYWIVKTLAEAPMNYVHYSKVNFEEYEMKKAQKAALRREKAKLKK